MTLWKPPKVLERGYVGAGGTGSISCRSITEDAAKEAADRKGPLGFAAPSEAAAKRDEWGEARWTDRDLRGAP